MRFTRCLTVLAFVLVCAGDGLARPDIPSTQSHQIRLRDEIGDPWQTKGMAEVFQWAIDRYETLGLELPTMTVTFHRNRSNCSGFHGLWTSSDGSTRVDMCVGGEKKRKHILLHEFAHAWVAGNLDQGDRDAFVSRRGLPGWSGTDIDHDSRGMEQAAETIAWGLNESCEPSKWLASVDQRELAAEFELLTGMKPLCTRP